MHKKNADPARKRRKDMLQNSGFACLQALAAASGSLKGGKLSIPAMIRILFLEGYMNVSTA